jgi:hypothetical protein
MMRRRVLDPAWWPRKSRAKPFRRALEAVERADALNPHLAV